MDEIVQEFLVESHENLDQLDRDLVELEQQPGARDLLASIFRTIHTIKGTSGFLAFSRLEAVTHVGENLLARLRDGKMSMTPATTDVLLRMVDVVRELLAAIEVDGSEGPVVVDDVVVAITRVLDDHDAAAATAAAPAPTAEADGVVADEPSPTAEHVAEPTTQVPVPSPFHGPVVEPVVQSLSEPALMLTPESASGVAEQPVEETASRRSVAESSVRVDVDLLDTLMRLVGELVLTRNQIVRQASEQEDQTLARSSQRLNQIATELQEGVMQTRMQPIDHLWQKLPRVVRDLGSQCGKQVDLVMVGKETELDRSLLEAIKDPLTHLVRNAVDHGLEDAQSRVEAGKSATGRLTLRAFHQGGQVVVEVADDGAGIDPARVAAKARERGLRTPEQLAAMTPADLLQLVFLPGFSTAAAVTNVSGRGVGMDVVRTNIEAIGGTIEMDSVLGRGTTCRLRIPLTLAIVPALTVESAGDRYAIPQASLLELVALDAERAARSLEDVNGAAVYRLRGALLPLVHLSDVLGVTSDRVDGHVLIAVLQADGRRFGLVIDRVLRTEEIVVKPLSTSLKTLGTYSGATILGDGRVALILDVQTLARQALSADLLERTDQETAATTRTTDGARLVVASIGDGRRVGIPVSSVARLERIAATTVERVGTREVVQYRGAVLPLLRLGQHLGAMPGIDPDELTVIVYTEAERSVAIVVDEILDIVDDEAELSSDISDFGLLGSTVIHNRIVEVLDVRSAIVAADPAFFAGTDPSLALQEAL